MEAFFVLDLKYIYMRNILEKFDGVNFKYDNIFVKFLLQNT